MLSSSLSICYGITIIGDMSDSYMSYEDDGFYHFSDIREVYRKIDISQKQPLGDVPGKRYSENMQQIYRRTPMPKCSCFATLLKSHFGMGVLL